MESTASFGYWLKRRRKALDLTQAALAQQVGCAVVTIRKIEADEIRPSIQIADKLAECLAIPPEERAVFLQAARAERSTDQLALPVQPVDRAEVAPAPADAILRPLPSGTVTFLFTDIEGSTALWEQHPLSMRVALARHNAILRAAVEAHGGAIFKTVGDAICAAFASAPEALAAALAAQRALLAENWEAIGALRVRMALHTGTAWASDGDYLGPPINRVARLVAAGYGGQILLSRATQELVREDLPPDVALRDLGEHRLKDLTRPDHIFQLVAADLPAEFPPLQTLGYRPHSLPVQLTALIGREREVAQVCALLRRADLRLVTLTGPGGTGKTRLAVQVAVELLDAFTDAVWFVDLAPLNDPTLVIPTIVQTLGLKEIGGQPPVVQLQAYLRDKRALVVLDNFEQVVEAAVRVAELLAAAPQLKMLVTSRVVLRLRGEQEFQVPPLALPNPKQLPPLEALSQYAAVELFIQRARDVKRNFQVTNANAPAVVEICARLDGLPLAIELAATRVKLFAPEALLKRLDRRLGVLTGGPRDVPTRQQTIRNTIDWSYQLLDRGEQTLFRRLGVFVGGCTIEAAEAVLADDQSDAGGELAAFIPANAILGGLESLIDKSLLRRADGTGDEPRFVMLETIREFALERLAEGGEEQTIRHRHATYCLAVAETAEPKLRSRARGHWLKLLDEEHDNLRAALAWSQQMSGAGELGLRLAGALSWFWDFCGFLSEGRSWVEGALTTAGGSEAPRAWANALGSAGYLAWVQEDYPVARARLIESVRRWRETEDLDGLAFTLSFLGMVACDQNDYVAAHNLCAESVGICRKRRAPWDLAFTLFFFGNVAYERGDYAAARPIFDESVALWRIVADPWGLALPLSRLGNIGSKQGDYAAAHVLLEEALALYRQVGHKWDIAYTLSDLADLTLCQGNYQEANAHLAASVMLFQELGLSNGMAYTLEQFARVAALQGQLERAARLWGAAQAWREVISAGLPLRERPEYERAVAAARAQLGDDAFAAAWTEGQAMSLEQAIAEALGAGG